MFHGTVVDVRPGQQFLVADAYWIPPEGDPIGPMALQVDCREGSGRLPAARAPGRLRASPRWRRYYAVVSRGWQISLTALKRYAETPGQADADALSLFFRPSARSDDDRQSRRAKKLNSAPIFACV